MVGEGDRRIFVGHLPPDVRNKDLENLFRKFGPIVFVDVQRNKRGPPFAYVEFEQPEDAADAVAEQNGRRFAGERLRVEFPRGSGVTRCSERQESLPRRSVHRCLVSGLPASATLRELKERMGDAGKVCFADVLGEGVGVVEFSSRDEMFMAESKLNDTVFRWQSGEDSLLKVFVDPKRDIGKKRSRSPRDSDRSPLLFAHRRPLLNSDRRPLLNADFRPFLNAVRRSILESARYPLLNARRRHLPIPMMRDD